MNVIVSMNVIVISTYRRPWQTRLCIEAIRRAQKWHQWADKVIVGIDPNGAREVYDTVCEFPWLRKVTLPSHMDAHSASKHLLDLAFKDYNADCALYVEDDVILSPDAFVLLDWMTTNRPDRVIGTCLYHETVPSDYPIGHPPDPYLLHLNNGVNTCGGTAFLRHAYLDILSPNWNCKKQQPTGFDYSIHYLMYKHCLYILNPDLSRSNGIGFFNGSLSFEQWRDHFGRSIWAGEHNGVNRIDQLHLYDNPPGRVLEPWMQDELRAEGISL